MKRNLSESWGNICEQYLDSFCEKHKFVLSDADHKYVWIGGNPGTVACIRDMFVNMDDMRYDIDHDIPEMYFEKWYWTNVKRSELGLRYMNYENFCKGTPDPISEEQLKSIMESREKVKQARQELDACVEEYKTSAKGVMTDENIENNLYWF